MIVLTHLEVAHYFYTHMKKEEDKSFKINKLAFLFGSIKPDITKMAKVKHHLDVTHETYSEHVKMVLNTSLKDVERSIALGVVCHYLCDYFCMYHARKPFNNYPLSIHFKYEIKLHLYIMTYLWKNKIEEAVNSIERRLLFDEEEIDLSSILSSYHCKEESMKTDTEFTFFAISKLMSKLFGITICNGNETSSIEELTEDNVVVGLQGGIVA